MVEGADLERLCGVTHRGFESLPLSHINPQTLNIQKVSFKYLFSHLDKNPLLLSFTIL